MVRATRNILKFEVIEVASSWVVASVDRHGNRFHICDYSHLMRAERRTSYLNAKLRGPDQSTQQDDSIPIPPPRPIH